MKKPTEKPHRLEISNYYGLKRCSFTMCIKNRTPVFSNHEIVNLFLDFLREATAKYRCINWIYVFMPDHVHILLEGCTDYTNLWKAINFFKQKTGYWFAKNMPQIKWQKSFYDHVHRTEKELINHILYIANNPVRKNLVKHWEQYPFTGSLDNALQDIIWW
jgi:putative transposase